MRTMRKRVLALALSTAMALSMCMTAQAAGPEVTVTLDGQPLVLEAPAYIEDDRTQVPVSIAGALGLEVVESAGQVAFSADGDSLLFTDGSSQAGELPNSFRIAAPSSPECWAMPIASRIGSTVTSGGKPT